jgi:hypothetical protein
MKPWLLALPALLLSLPAAAYDDVAGFTEHSVRKATVAAYDPLHHLIIVEIDYEPLVLHTERAVVYGKIEPGRLVDVTYESETYRVHQVLVRPDKIRAMGRP